MNDKILWELRQLVWDVLEEAKKKKKGEEKGRPDGYFYSEAFDFSDPLGAFNLYKLQGGASWGPNTSTMSPSGENRMSARDMAKAAVDVAIRPYMKEAVRDFVKGDISPWAHLLESSEKNVWAEAHIGFKNLKNKLAHKPGVKSPGGLAAKIGQKKYGKKGMAAKAAAGKK